MNKKENKDKSFYYRQTYRGKNYCTKNYWCPGDPLQEGDEKLLLVVKGYYQKYGVSPTKKDVPIEVVGQLKNRFRTWKNVILAAGLPELNGADAQSKRKEVSEKKAIQSADNYNE